jgi:hypothetical protein
MAHLSRRQPQNKTGQDHPIHLHRPTTVLPDDPNPGHPAGPGYAKKNIPKLCQQVTTEKSVSPILLIASRHLHQVEINLVAQPILQDLP